MPAGRPRLYSLELAKAVLHRLADGESLRAICRDESMPCKTTVLAWALDIPEFSIQYARARELQAEGMAEEIVDIADDGSNDWMERNEKDNAGWLANGENINRSRLRVDARKWIASRLLPKKYGDQVEHKHTGTITLAQLITEAVSHDRAYPVPGSTAATAESPDESAAGSPAGRTERLPE